MSWGVDLVGGDVEVGLQVDRVKHPQSHPEEIRGVSDRVQNAQSSPLHSLTIHCS